jgi:hypothetical protein
MIRSLEFRNGAFSGNVGARLLNGLVKPSIPGSGPAPGLYYIAAPVEDAVFGLVSVMTPVGVAAGSSMVIKFWQKDTPLAGKFFQKESSLGGKFIDKWAPLEGKFFKETTSQGGGAPIGTSFVLCSRPIAGRNCLVIQSGLSDLLDALKNSGGAEVRVY